MIELKNAYAISLEGTLQNLADEKIVCTVKGMNLIGKLKELTMEQPHIDRMLIGNYYIAGGRRHRPQVTITFDLADINLSPEEGEEE